ncbi:hypothetical protein GR212_15205 [Rhizobium lusitanum]|uniref:Uncharacterized protein n=1 Tax=Rhizobium lusitanum TaxID=293958 RepID=A0A6L9U9Z6_9HYPH|nr:hypothetical protein [Rhizobium lusitanum]NEI70930.1 hypothetical protein [Rhizobium lusitanum]
MKRMERLAGRALRPKELEIAERVFDLVSAQPWFDRSEYCLDGFAIRLINLVRSGIANSTQLETIAVLWAMTNFSCDMTKSQRMKLLAAHEAQRHRAIRT